MVVDDERRVLGVVSLSDILNFLVLRPASELTVLKYCTSCEKIFLGDIEPDFAWSTLNN